MTIATHPEAVNHQITDLVESFLRNYYHEHIGELAQAYPTERSIYVDWHDLYKHDQSLANDFLVAPGEMHWYGETALAEYDLPIDVDLSDAHFRLHGLNAADIISIPELRARHLGNYVAVQGDISKVSQDTPRPVVAAFECSRCGTNTEIPQHSEDLQEPHECQGCERSGPFRLNPDKSEWVDHQMVRITQPASETKSGQGASVDVLLRDDAVEPLGQGRLTPGNRVTINGLYTTKAGSDGTKPYIQGRAVTVEETDYSTIDIQDDDIERFHSIANGDEGDPFELFRQSLAPTHYGDDAIKMAIVLQLARGVRSQQPDGSWQRGDSHILIIGDPSVGKSDLLGRAAKVSPRSAQTSGKGASSAGLTAAAVPSDFGDEKWSVEAGVLVHADKGIACVDELDKVDDDAVSSMHDALEGDQTVKFSKAGMNTNLPARCSLLAAGNPDWGRFDPSTSVIDQVDIPATLLSRFDLMFPMRDNPEKNEDKLVAENMVRDRQLTIAHDHDDTADTDESIDPPLSHEFFRKYIAYARRNYHPRLDPYEDQEVLDHLVKLFIELRGPVYQESQSVVPVTRRKIQGLQRLSEASARLRLSDRVEKEDVNRAADLVLESMQALGVNEDGQFDADIVETGVSSPQRDQIQTVKELIAEHEDEHEDGLPIHVFKELIEDVNGINWDRAEFQMEKLKQQGELYEPASGHIRTS